MKPQFSSARFETAHWKKPRGTGRWAFFFDNNDSDHFFANGTFGHCKKLAMAFAVANNKSFVHVDS